MIGHDEAARLRIESLERFLKLAYCATHTVHFGDHPQLGTPTKMMCPKRNRHDECFVSIYGEPQFDPASWETTCPRCGGNGKVYEIPEHDGKQLGDSPVSLSCEHCCPGCGGTGMKDDDLVPMFCPKCDGSGKATSEAAQ